MPGAVERARATVVESVRACHETGTGRLPTVRQLAAKAGVCHVTMQKAVRALRREGTLHTRWGSGLFVGPVAATAREDTPAQSGTALARTVRRLEHEIASGMYRSGGLLPLQKQLCASCGIGRDTARRAMQQLVARSVVRPEGGRYRVLSASRRPAMSGSVVVSRFGLGRTSYSPASRHVDTAMAFENACIRANLSLSNVFYSFTGAELIARGPAKPPPYSPRDLESVMGFAVFTRGLHKLGLSQHLRTLLEYGKPVVVLDEDGLYASGRAVPRRKNLRIFPVGYSPSIGVEMGRLLVGLGHRRVAYLDPYPNVLWSQNRLEGLRKAYRAAGSADAVVHVPIEPPSPGPLYDASGRYMGDVAASLADAFDTRDRVQAELARIVRTDKSLALAVDLMAWYETDSLTKVVTAAVDSILPRTDITAFVAASDAVAVAAILRLEAKGLRVPADRSVAGFDDGYVAHLFDLTTYNFNGAASVQAMVDFIVSPGWRPLAVAPDCVVEVDGYVKERATTGPCGVPRPLG